MSNIMKLINKVIFLLISTLVIALIFARNSYGYLDPGTGSYILQIVLASALGLLFSVKIFWTRIKDFFRKVFARKSDE